MNPKWFYEDCGNWHVVPDDDLIAHEVSPECPCGPAFQVVDGVDLMVHQTLEEREDLELGEWCEGCKRHYEYEHNHDGA